MPLDFHLHLDVIGVLVAAAVGYEYAVRRLAGRHAFPHEPIVTRRQRLLFYGALLAAFVVSTYPFHDIAEERLFTFHMVEHLVLAFVVPPMLLSGVPSWVIRLLVRPVRPVVRFLTRPLVALLAFNAWLAYLHVPPVVELMITSDAFHLLAHALLFLTALMMWWPVLDPVPDTHTLTPFGKMGYLFLQGIVPNIPASFLTLGSSPLYPIYGTFPRMWGIDVMTDQIVAGLVMKIGGTLLLWGFIAWIWFSWYRDERRHETGPILVERA